MDLLHRRQRMHTLREVCVNVVARQPEFFTSFKALPSSLIVTLFQALREHGTLRRPLGEIFFLFWLNLVVI